jgi:hypothetical protein
MSKPSFHIKENSLLAKFAAMKLQTKSVAMVLGKTIHLYGSTKENFLCFFTGSGLIPIISKPSCKRFV